MITLCYIPLYHQKDKFLYAENVCFSERPSKSKNYLNSRVTKANLVINCAQNDSKPHICQKSEPIVT